MLLLSSGDFLGKQLFQKIFRNTISVKQFSLQIRADILSVLIWVQTVCIFLRLSADEKSLLANKEISTPWARSKNKLNTGY